MKRNIFETFFGACVLFIATGFVVHALSVSQYSSPSYYTVKAIFPQIDGLNVGDDILMSGIKVGYVSKLDLVRDPFRVQAEFKIRDQIKLWQDAVATVSTTGLFGGKYIALDPGGGEDVQIKSGQQILYTQGAVLLDETLRTMVEIGRKAHQQSAPKVQEESESGSFGSENFGLGLE